MFLKKLFKWLFILAGALAVAALVVVWPVLGVNPFEGPVDRLWRLVSNEADLYVQFPGTRLLEEPLARGLERQAGLERIEILREELQELTRDVAEQVNPQVPLGLFKVNVKEDLLGQEMAFGAQMVDYQNLKFSNFVVVTRVPFYARFVSALRRGFVRSKLPANLELELKSGKYFRFRIPQETAQAMRSWRTVVQGMPEDVLYMARIRDAVVISDTEDWIRHALRGGTSVLPADAWFETEFQDTEVRGRSVEVFVRRRLAAPLLWRRANEPGGAGLLSFVDAVVPGKHMVGYVTARLRPVGDDAVRLEVTNRPEKEADFKNITPALQRLYDAPKGNPKMDLSQHGIGKFIPKRRTVGAIVVHLPTRDLPELVYLNDGLTKQIGEVLTGEPDVGRRTLDEIIRESSSGRFMGFGELLAEITRGLEGTHLVVLHRLSEFEDMSYSDYDVWGPDGRLSVTLVSRVDDQTAPDAVRQTIEKHLTFMNMEPAGAHESGLFYEAKQRVGIDEDDLTYPCYGVMPGGEKYIFFSTHPEAALAVCRAAQEPDSRLIQDPELDVLVGRLPAEATAAVVLQGDLLHAHLGDLVRVYATGKLNLPLFKKQFVEREQRAGREPTNAEIKAAAANHAAIYYPEYKEEYENAIAPVDSVDLVTLAMTLGADPSKRVRVEGLATFFGDDEEEPGRE